MTNRATAARKFAVHHNEEVTRGFEKVITAGEEATRRIENTYARAAHGTIEFHQKLLTIAQANVDAAFDCARDLVGVTSPSEFIEVSTKHARHRFQAMSQQTRELAELAQKAAIESVGPFATGLGGVLLGRPDLS
jgi:phasin